MSTTILTLGGGGFLMEPDNPLLDDFLLSLATRRRGAGDRPRVLYVPTAAGDDQGRIADFEAAFAERAETDVLSLFRRDGRDLREQVLAADVVYVGGGSTLNLLALWRLHGLDEVLREAGEAGVVLAGISAGMNCWFEGSVTDSWGPLDALSDGLGLLRGSACPHYDGEAERQPTYVDLVGRGVLPSGYAADDGCALLFRDGELVEAVSSRPDARAFRVHRAGDADGLDDAMEAVPVAESPVDVRFLG